MTGRKGPGGLSRRRTARAFQEPCQALLRYGGPVPPGPSGDAGGRAEVREPDSGVRSGDWQGIKRASPGRGRGLQSRSAVLLAGWGLGGYKPEFPTREDVYEEQETLNPTRREK